jgi:hypothetical protein
VSTQFLPRLILGCVVTVFGLTPAAIAQAPSVPASSNSTDSSESVAQKPGIHGVINLTGPWRFQIGDDPQWAGPSFDDSSWPIVDLNEPLTSQGIEPYAGYAWYRLRIEANQLAAFDPHSSNGLDLLVTGISVGQLAAYIDGVETGHSRGMTTRPALYLSPPFAAPFGAATNNSRVLAIRTWIAPGEAVHRGLLGKVELGTHDEIAERVDMAKGHQWNEHVIAALVVTFLFLCVAGLGAALYLAQRNHSEYLWLALLCLAVATRGASEAAYGLAWMPLSLYIIFKLFVGRVFIAVTLEFILRFTASPYRKIVRILQISALLLPFIHFLHVQQIEEFLSVSVELLFCAVVCVLLFQAWRRGRKEAGVMLLPFFVASAWDSIASVLEYAAARHWIPDKLAPHPYYLGPIEFGAATVAYLVFLASLVAVILYRFIRVSQDEQRSNAEISAARSVQALLIPTQLPSTRNFMLESAYLPVNGVGGDFFQVLPLKDDSLLIVVGDVSGKGLQAAMNSSTLVGALRNELSHDPATVLGHLNHVLLGAVSTPGAVPELDAAPCFATCLCARIYPDGTLAIANAGHLSPYRDGRELALAPSLPLGVIVDSAYEQTTFQLNRGDRLVFLSDGVVEAMNHHGELFGFERTQQVSNESARYIAQTAQRFGQTDDITVVSLYVASRTAGRNSHEMAHSG